MWKCRPLGWLWGLPLLALLGMLVFFGERRNVEADLTDRVTGALEDAGLGWAKPSFVGRDGVLTGTAGSVREREDAVALAEKSWGVRILEEKTEQLRQASPYTWSAVKNGARLALGGFVPQEEDRQAVVTMAKSQFPDSEIVDELEIAAGSPEHRVFMDGAGFGLKQLAGFDRGSVGLSDVNFSIEGLTRDAETYEAVKKAVDSELPQGLKLASQLITAPAPVVRAVPAPAPEPTPAPAAEVAPEIHPYVWRADYHSKRVTLSGNVPDQSTRDMINARAKERFAGVEVVDQMEIGNGALANWDKAIETALGELSALQAGSSTVWDNEVYLRGRTESEERRSEVLGRLAAGLPENYQVVSQEVSVPEPVVVEAPKAEVMAPPPVVEVKPEELQASTPLQVDDCQLYLNSILGKNHINFKVASAELEPESFAALVGLSHVANRCPKTRIEIAGHTDSDGSATFNDMLSLRRAHSVVDYLAKEGVSPDRLSAVGHGKSRPLVPNTTDANKAVNRRIEFLVKEF